MSEIKKDEYLIALKPDFKTAEKSKAYSNYVSVTHDAFSFIFSFCDTHLEAVLKDQLSEKDAAGAYIVKAPIVAQVVIPGDLMENFIAACKENLELFKKKKDGAAR